MDIGDILPRSLSPSRPLRTSLSKEVRGAAVAEAQARALEALAAESGAASGSETVGGNGNGGGGRSYTPLQISMALKVRAVCTACGQCVWHMGRVYGS